MMELPPLSRNQYLMERLQSNPISSSSRREREMPRNFGGNHFGVLQGKFSDFRPQIELSLSRFVSKVQNGLHIYKNCSKF